MKLHVRAYLTSPEFMRRLHGLATFFWVGMAVPSVLWWKESVPYLVGLSVYAVVTGHWSSWQASRAEVSIEAQTTP